MDDQSILLWVLISLIFVVTAWWHTRENNQLAKQLPKRMDAESAQKIVRFAWARTIQLLMAIVLSIMVIVIYDWQIMDVRNSLDTLTSAVEQKEKLEKKEAQDHRAEQAKHKNNNQPPQAQNPNTPVNPAPVANQPQTTMATAPAIAQPNPPSPAAAPASQPVTPAIIPVIQALPTPVVSGHSATQPAMAQTPPINNAPALPKAPAANIVAKPPAPVNNVANQPAVVPQAAPLPSKENTVGDPAIESADNAMGEPPTDADPDGFQEQSGYMDNGATVDDVYNPEHKNEDAQSSMDDIKKRYEDILVIYFFLKKCSKVNPADYNTITSALSQEMASVDAPGRLQYDILTAAQGSYKELYADSPCEGNGIVALNRQYKNYIKVLNTSFPPQ